MRMVTRDAITPLIIGNDMCQRFCFYGLRSLLYIFIRSQMKKSYAESMLVVHGFFALSYVSSLLGAVFITKVENRIIITWFLSFIYFSGTILLTYSSFVEEYFLTIISLGMIALGSGCLKTCIGMNLYKISGSNRSEQQLDNLEIFSDREVIKRLKVDEETDSEIEIDKKFKKEIKNEIEKESELVNLNLKNAKIKSLQIENDRNNDNNESELNDIEKNSKRHKINNKSEEKINEGYDEQSEDEIKSRNIIKNLYIAVYTTSMFSMIWTSLFAQMKCFGRDSCYGLSFGFGTFLLLCSLILYYCSSSKQEIDKYEFGSIKKIILPICKNVKNLALFKKMKSDENSKESTIPHISNIFLPIVIFWILFDQQVSKWIEQGNNMKMNILQDWQIISREIPIINSLLVMMTIPALLYLLFPTFRRLSDKVDPLSKIFYGFVCASFSFFISAFVEYTILTSKSKISILWQIPQYSLMGISEILFNSSAMSFVCAGAAKEMKGPIMTVWLLSVAIGNVIIIFISRIDLSTIIKINPKITSVCTHISYGLLGTYGCGLLKRFCNRRINNDGEIMVPVKFK